MSGLNVRQDEGRVVLSWETASETQNAGFRVQYQVLPGDDSTAFTATRRMTVVH